MSQYSDSLDDNYIDRQFGYMARSLSGSSQMTTDLGGRTAPTVENAILSQLADGGSVEAQRLLAAAAQAAGTTIGKAARALARLEETGRVDPRGNQVRLT